MNPLGFLDQVVCMLTGHEPATGQRYSLVCKTREDVETRFEVVPCRRCGVLFWAPWVGSES